MMRVHNRTKDASRAGTALWLMVALLAMIVVLLINGGPLFYYDTAGYFANGGRMFRMLGLFVPPPGAGGGAGGAATNDGMVVGSRSAIYALFVTFFLKQGALWLAVVVQSALLVATIHLAAHAVLGSDARTAGALPDGTASAAARATARATALASLAGVLGSAGFYTAYLMPDIFLPLLLLAIATLAAFADRLGLWPVLALLAIGMVSVVMHPSHLAVALLMVPVAALVPLVLRQRRWWLPGLLAALIAGTGVMERLAFSVAVQTVTTDEVVYLPFFTARLISDGPGKRYLDETCPPPAGTAARTTADPAPGTATGPATGPATEMATCALNALLVRPQQLSPDVILFSRDPALASFTTLTAGLRKAIAGEQRAFLTAVLRAHPMGVVRAALWHTLEQMGLVSIDMTIAQQSSFDTARQISPDMPATLAQGRLFGGGHWITVLTLLHQIYYGLAGVALLALIVLPQSRLPRRLRLFAVLVILGILANAFVTGAISQPANRYGARAIFLIPVLLVLLALARPAAPKTREARP